MAVLASSVLRPEFCKSCILLWAEPDRVHVIGQASSVILVLKETEAAKADALVGRFWALGQIRAWSWPRRVLDLDAPLT